MRRSHAERARARALVDTTQADPAFCFLSYIPLLSAAAFSRCRLVTPYPSRTNDNHSEPLWNRIARTFRPSRPVPFAIRSAYVIRPVVMYQRADVRSRVVFPPAARFDSRIVKIRPRVVYICRTRDNVSPQTTFRQRPYVVY